MPSEAQAAVALAIAAALSAGLMPVMARVARRTGVLDHPVGYKEHERPTAYLGGVAILLGVLAATLATAGFSSPVPAVAAAAVAICVLGTMDDRSPIPPGLRLVLQAAIAAAVWKAGAGWGLDVPGWANLVLTMGWVVLATNAFNLLDNLDGTAAAAAAPSALGIAVIALSEAPAEWSALVAAAVLGGSLAFLPYNLSRPSRIFLGDGGSTLLGFLLAVAAMGAVTGQPGSIGVVAVALLAGVAIFDAAITLASRRRRGIPALTGGRDHVTHRILAWAGSARRTAGVVATAQLALSAIAVAAVELGLPAIPVAAVVLAVLAIPAGLVIWRGQLGSSVPASRPLPPVRRAG